MNKYNLCLAAILCGMAQAYNLAFAVNDTEMHQISTTEQTNKVDKAQAEKTALESDKHVSAQAQAINQIPGPKLSSEDLKESKVHKKGVELNPIAWLFKPVTRLQEQSVRLEQQIMKLTGPIGALQPSMLGLQQKMSSVQKQMGGVNNQMTAMQEQIGQVQKQMSYMQEDISGMHSELSSLRKPIIELKKPVVALQGPLERVAKPIEGLEQRLSRLETLLGLILTSVIIAAVLVAVGTPIAAILVWRNKHKLLPPLKPNQATEEAIFRQTPNKATAA